MLGFRMDGPRFVERACEKEVLPKAIARSVMKSTRSVRMHRRMRCIPVSSICYGITLMVLTELDINPNNILLSDIDCASPVVKLEDLGNRMRYEETLFTNLSNDPSVAGRLQQISYTIYRMQGT